MTSTRSTTMAVLRIANHFPRIKVTRMERGEHKGTYKVEVKGDRDGVIYRRPAKALAWLADLVRHRPDAEAVRAAVRYDTPNIPSSGMAAWEMMALEWIAGYTPPPPRRKR